MKGKDYSVALVFQYGSNTSCKRLNSEDRLKGDACRVGIAYTEEDHELEFDIWSKKNNCAAADINPGSGRKIWGVLYEIPEYLIFRETSGDRKSLDQIEGENKNYKRVTISLLNPNGSKIQKKIITYIGKNRRKGIKTSWEYVCHIIDGLHGNNVPIEYIDYVKSQIIDNNPDLKTRVEALV